MSAYVKFLEGPDMGRKMIVSLTKFKNKNVDKNFDPKKKYYVQSKDDQYYKAQVIFIEDNADDLKQKIKDDRSRCKSAKNLQTETEDEDNFNKLNKSESVKILTANKEARMKKYATLLGMKTEVLLPILNRTSDNEQDINEANKNEQDDNKTNEKVQDSNDTSKKLQDNTQIETSEHIKKDDKTLKSHNKATKPKDAENKENVNKTMRIRLVSDNSVHIPEVCQSHVRKLEKQVAEMEKLKKTNAQLKKDYDKLKSKINDLKAELETEKTRSKNFEDLNIKIQKSVIDMFDQKNVVTEQLENAKKDIFMDHGKNFVPVGFLNASENTVHIGRGQKLQVKDYNVIMAAKSPQQCVGNAIIEVFTEPVLLKSTITGNVSNKTIGKNKKNKNEKEKQKVEKLDEVKLLACQDLFIHWLKTQYSLVVKDLDLHGEIANFNVYVSKKISYLKRPASKPKKRINEIRADDEESRTSEADNQVEVEVHKVPDDTSKNVVNNNVVEEVEPQESTSNKVLRKIDLNSSNLDEIQFVSTEIVDNQNDNLSDTLSEISEKISSFSDDNDGNEPPSDPLED